VDCPTSGTISSPSGRRTGGTKAACSSLCAPALSGRQSEAEIQTQRSQLLYKLHSAARAWCFPVTAEKTSPKLFCKVVSCDQGAVVTQQLPLMLKGYKNTAVRSVLRGGDLELRTPSSRFPTTLQRPLISQFRRF